MTATNSLPVGLRMAVAPAPTLRRTKKHLVVQILGQNFSLSGSQGTVVNTATTGTPPNDGHRLDGTDD